MARVIANHVARQQNPKIISMDDVENLIRQRLTFVTRERDLWKENAQLLQIMYASIGKNLQ